MTLSGSRGPVLVVGAGGREHAIAWKLSLSPRVSRVVVAPGNDGMPASYERWSVDLSRGRAAFVELAHRARGAGVTLAVIGPDDPLAMGIADVFTEEGVPVFGPTARAAQIEASKAFAKDVMSSAGVPTARYRTFESAEAAQRFLREEWRPPGWVIKADGLALGKGVRVCGELGDALTAASELIGISGRVLIEEKLSGRESSWLAFCDGERAVLLPPARDHKRLLDGDLGPNTGGMGAYSPVADIPNGFGTRVRSEVFLPTLRELKKRGAEFRGVLYAGLMVQGSDYKVLEFNARFGDPETQVLLARLDGDLYDWCERASRGDLPVGVESVQTHPESAVVVVAASEGYPERTKTGARLSAFDRIRSADGAGDLGVPSYFAASIRREGETLAVSGGRVFGAMGIGTSLAFARAQAYERMESARFTGMQCRKDIAREGIGS